MTAPEGTGPAAGTAGALRELVARSLRLGADPALVLYGGGNTSAKGETVDHLGRRQRVMWVKGSGADLARSTEDDFPALRLDELLPLRDLAELADEQMVDLVARALLDPRARRPSIETLLHAFLPYSHVDHVHADAICVLTNHAEGPRVVREALGERFAYVDWIRPGFALSRIVGDLPGYDGVVLAHHGLVTWADDSDTCLRRTLDTVARADRFLTEAMPAADPPPGPRHDDLPPEEVERLLVHLRGAVGGTGRRVLRTDSRLRPIADRPDVETVAAAGVATADHLLRIKPRAAVITDPADPARARAAIEAYAHRYQEYVARHPLPAGTSAHDPMPRAMLVPGLGAITTGRDRRDAEIAADIALHSHTVAARVADAFGPPAPLSEVETFGVDYWPLELYKLTLQPPPPQFAGVVVVVTGAASGIGRAVAQHLSERGASLVLADLDEAGAQEVAAGIARAGGAEPVVVAGDQADEAVAAATVSAAVRAYGGLDGAVLSAGIAATGTLDALPPADWHRTQQVNTTAAFLLTQAALRVLREQGIGGSLVYIASKNALGPGAGFGAYSASKAALLQLMRIAALEGGSAGIRANAVNPDAVFEGSRLWEGGIREGRAAVHGIAPDELEEFYAARNLLHVRVRPSDVAAAVAFLLSDDSSRTTGAILPVDGGVPTAFPR